MKQTLALKLLFGLALTLGALPAFAQTQPVATQPGFTANGERACLTCHGGDPKVTAILKSPMAVKGDPRTPFAIEGCEGCHGASPDHAAGKAPYPAIVFKGPHESPLKVRNDVCLSCHQAGLRMNWQGSAMERAGIACTDCHDSHAAKDPMLVRTEQVERCFTCHARQRADSFKYSHHPNRTGAIAPGGRSAPTWRNGSTRITENL